MLITTLVSVSLIPLGVKFNTWCESGIKLTPTGVEINTNLVWTSHKTVGVTMALNLTPEFFAVHNKTWKCMIQAISPAI